MKKSVPQGTASISLEHCSVVLSPRSDCVVRVEAFLPVHAPTFPALPHPFSSSPCEVAFCVQDCLFCGRLLQHPRPALHGHFALHSCSPWGGLFVPAVSLPGSKHQTLHVSVNLWLQPPRFCFPWAIRSDPYNTTISSLSYSRPSQPVPL